MRRLNISSARTLVFGEGMKSARGANATLAAATTLENMFVPSHELLPTNNCTRSSRKNAIVSRPLRMIASYELLHKPLRQKINIVATPLRKAPQAPLLRTLTEPCSGFVLWLLGVPLYLVEASVDHLCSVQKVCMKFHMDPEVTSALGQWILDWDEMVCQSPGGEGLNH